MNLATYARRNLFRRRGRTILTVLAVAVAVLIFSAIRTVGVTFNAAADDAMSDRLATRHKVSITMQLPRRYIDEVRALPGVTGATSANWFGAKDPKERIPFFAGFAADDKWFDVFDDMKVDPAQLAEWKTTPSGVILGDILAKTFGVKPGDRLTITSDIYPGDWEFKVVGIYMPQRRTVDRNSLIMHWEYLNNDPRAELTKDQIGWVMTRIGGGVKSADMSRTIDKIFDERDDQTVTMSERAFNLSFIGAFAAVLTAFDLVSIVILLIMMLILANTIAMSVRERTHEYGVLRAIGFLPRHIVIFILGEGVVLGLLGGVLGLAIGYPFVQSGLGPVLEQNLGAFFPFFRVSPGVAGASLALAVALGFLAAVVPARSAAKLEVIGALRRIG